MRPIIPFCGGLLLLLVLAGPGQAQQGAQVSGTFDPAVPHLELPTLLTDDGQRLLLDVPPALLAGALPPGGSAAARSPPTSCASWICSATATAGWT